MGVYNKCIKFKTRGEKAVNILEVNLVKKIYGSKSRNITTALEDISFSMEEGGVPWYNGTFRLRKDHSFKCIVNYR